MRKMDVPRKFDDYWKYISHRVEKTTFKTKETLNILRSNELCDCYEIRFPSFDNYQLFGYLSIPLGNGKYPAIFSGSSYRSSVEPLFQGEAVEKRGKFVIFSAASRGQRNADVPFAAKYPGLFTEGIDSPYTYVYREIIGDWLMGVKYLVSRPEVDLERVLVVKHNSLPLIVGSLCDKITHVIAKPGFFAGIPDKNTDEIDDYLRMYPCKRRNVIDTLSYFNLEYFCEGLKAETLLWGTVQNLSKICSRITSNVNIHQSEKSQFKDGLLEEKWIANKLGLPNPIIPACWET